MATTAVPFEEIMLSIREQRSSESNFESIVQELDKAIGLAQRSDNTALAENLQEVKDKHASGYEKAKETGGTAWPEFEKFITQFERSLTEAAKEEK